MKNIEKILLNFSLVLVLVFLYGSVLGQHNVPATGNDTYNTCSGNLYDSGGPGGDYGISQDGYTVLTPTVAGNSIQISGSLDSESGWDYLYVYNGVGTGGTLLWSSSGLVAIPTITSSDASGALTVRFTSDASVVDVGFDITINCVIPVVEMLVPSSGNNSYTVCSGNLYDSGGSLGAYANSSDGYTVLYPDVAGNVIEISGVTDGENCCDYVEIYDGVGTGGTLLGTYHLGEAIPTFASTDPSGAITVRFYSDSSVTGVGFDITINCVGAPVDYPMTDGNSVTTCSGIFYDPEGGSAGYADIGGTITQTFCSGTAESIRFNFTVFNTNEANDNLTIYDGPNTGSPVMGIFDLTSGPGAVTSSGTCLTFEWTTDSNQDGNDGWAASITCVPTPISNDECFGALPLVINPDYACGTVTAGTVVDATASADASACFGTADDDVWFSFVATTTAHRVSIVNAAGSTTDMYHAVYSGACGSLTEVSCNDGDITDFTGMTIGDTYYVRVYTWTSTTGQTSTFDVCVGTAPPPPTNDECAGEIELTVNPDGSCATVTPGYTTSASASSESIGTCGGTANDDVWYSFVADATVHTVSILNIVGTTTDMYHAVYSGSCGSLTELMCNDGNVTSLGGLTIGDRYYVRVYTWSSTVGATVDFDMCIGTPPPPPSNDECSGDIALTVNPTTSCTNVTHGYTTFATASADATACFGTANDDVWYSFEADNDEHIVSILNATGTTTDMYHAVYSGSCGSLTEISCNDGDVSSLSGLTIGDTYYVRVYTYSSTVGATVDFDICVGTPSPPPECYVSEPFCTSNAYSFPAATDVASYGDIGCLGTTPNAAWYYMEIDNPGDIEIDITSGGDVDFIAWGPFNSLAEGCTNISMTECVACPMGPDPSYYPVGYIVDCSYSIAAAETAHLTGTQAGEVYILLITNFANIVTNIDFAHSAGAGTTNCGIIAPPISSNSSLCIGETLELYVANPTAGATYAWTGPDGWTSSAMEPTRPNITLAMAGTYSLIITVGGVDSPPVTTDVVIDITDPTASNPAPIIVECLSDVPAQNPTVVIDEADDITLAPIVAWVSDVSDGNTCPEVITRTYSVTDDCGHSINVIQTITIDDITNPTASNPVAINVECIGDVPAFDIAVVNDEADNCTAAPVVAHVGDVSDGNTCPEVITRTYSVTDDCGNSINVIQTITIDDITNPTASNLAAINVECVGDVPAMNLADVNDEADNCTAAPVVAFVGDVSDGNTCPEVITRTYSVTDDCGNTINVTQIITIDDVTNPTASNLSAINVECVGDVPVMNIADVNDEADNCTAAPVVAHVGDVSDGNTCPEVITRTYSVTDDCGNTINVTQIITIDDVTDPTASNLAAVNVECVGDVPAMNIADVNDEADNCTAAPVVAHVGDVSDGNTCPEVITRTYSVTDDCGNSINVTQTITINDITPPTASNLAAVNIECVGDVPAMNIADVNDEADNCTAVPVVAFVGDVSDGNTCPEIITRTYSVTDDCGNTMNVTQIITVDDITNPTASNAAQTVLVGGPAPAPDVSLIIDEADNCTAAPVVAFVSQVSDGNFCPESIIYTYSVTDDCGNTINVTHEVLITDLIFPTASNPLPISVECVGDVPIPDITVVTDEADNGGVPTVAFVSDVSDGNTCPEVITRTYSVTDDCANSINVTQTITVLDITNPTASNPVAINVECAGDVPVFDLTLVTDEADNCTAAPVVAYVSDVSDGNTCPEVITRTFSVTDDCGNTINVIQIITVLDITPPTASNLAAVNIECVGDVPAMNIADVNDEADNCTAVPVVAFVGDVSDGNTCPEIITRTYSVTDDCGNSINITQIITIDDITNPTASNAAQTVLPGGLAPAPDVTVIIDEADNCTAAPVVAFVSQVSDGNFCPESIIYTYSVTDDCGNSINVTHEILIADPILPTASNPLPINVECIADVPVPDVTVVTDEADNGGPPVVAFVSDVSDGNTCPEVITRTYSVTDDCANVIYVTQTITVLDITNPTASNPVAINVECAGDVPVFDITLVTDEADNCTAAPVVAYVGDVSDGNTCPEVITRTYSVTDDCGNTVNVTQIITVLDVTLPTASNPVAINIECVGDVPAFDITLVTDEADNCTAAPVVAFVGDVSDGNTCPEVITRTYSVTDDCGNTINVTQIITILDVTLPTASNLVAINVECVGDVPAFDITLVTDEADNCTAAPVVAFVGDVSDGNTCPEVITRTYSVTDDCGNTINVTQIITVLDITNPTASNPVAINVECAGDVPVFDITLVTDEADNCTAAPVVAHVGDVSDGNTCPEVITRTYSVTDDCGNTINVTQIITVNDITNPTASNPVAINVECAGDVPVFDITLVTDEADNCTAAPVVAHVGDVSDGNTCPEVITRTYSVTDDCGNSINVTQTITVLDITNPTASNPVAINIECVGDVPAFDITLVTDEADNCTAAPVVAFVGDVSDGNTCPEVITRTYSVTDDCGNTINVTQIITVLDITNPTASNPVAINVECAGDVPVFDITLVTDEADNCTAAPVVAHVGDVSDGNTCPEVITRTYSVTDDCGNTINVTQIITVNDITNPTASNPVAINVECAGDVPVFDITLVTDEADNCTAAPVVAFVGDVSDGNTCPEVITRTYSVTDDCGNTINVTQTITVLDITNPTASNPVAINVECAGDVPVFDITLVTDEADNCTAAPVVAHVGDVSDGNTCPEVITRTYSVTDDCGNSINVTQTITVLDITNPTASNLAAVNVECITDISVVNIADVNDEADNCSVAPVVAHVSDVSDGNTCPEVITRTYSVTDDCGNSISVTQIFTINDITLPTASNPAQITIPGGPIPAPDVTVVTDEADNCTVAPVVAFVSQVSDGNPCPESIVYTYSVTDDCGNTINVTHEVLITDPILPTASNPLPINVECITDIPVPDVTVVTDEADNGGAPVVVFVSDVSDGNTCPEVITRTYSVTDDCANTINVTQTITVLDITNPTASNPIAINVECAADVPVFDITLVTDEADNCLVAPIVAHVSDVSDGNTCPEVITRTYSVTDDCGNAITVTQTITVLDITNPTASNPVAINVECVGDVPVFDLAVVTDEADNCTAIPVVAFVSDMSDGNTCPEIITRTYSVTDDCGNSINVTQIITVLDITNPTASNPIAINVECAGDVPVFDLAVVTDEADNCTAIPVVAFVSDMSDGNTCPEVITRTYSVTDDCANTINVIQTITVLDITNPTASNPVAINVECSGDVPAFDIAVVTDEVDNCTAAPVVAFVGDVSDGNTCPEVITRTYSVTDDCANTINVTQTITVLDITNPTASNPIAINVECSGDVPAFDITVVTDEADNCTAAPVVAFVGDVSDGNTCPEVITRTYSVTDDCGNSINLTQTITVLDITNPTASNLSAVNVECITDVPVVNIADVNDEADNCTVAPVVAYVSDVSDGNTCPEVITRTYSVTDDCGNTINVTQIITVNDITNPTASNAAQTVVPGGPIPAPDVNVIIDEADNCTAAPVVAFVSQVSDGNACPESIVFTYSVTDDCGNSINVTHEVLITDPILPTASNPLPINVECIADVPVPDVNVVTDEADNSSVPVVAFVSDVSDGNTCPEVITRTYSVTDDCTNTINVTQIITILDITLPTASNPVAINVECSGDVPAFDITVVTDEADNCTAAPVVAFVGDVSDGNTCPEVITRTYSVTDDCGNSINLTQTITVLDITIPTASNPVAINVECAGDVPVFDITVVTDEADNCTVAPVVAHVSDVSDGNTCPEVITRTYSVTDDCGNSINVTQTITVLDITNPTASNPVAINVECSGDVPVFDLAVVTDEADNCTAAPVVAHVSDVSDGNTCPEVITRTYSVADDCGNSINVTQTITVLDITNPTASNLVAINVECITDVPAMNIADVNDEADNCTVIPVVAFVSDVSDGNTCPEVITRTYSVTDDCGNSINVTQIITILPATSPNVPANNSATVECLVDAVVPTTPIVTDVCGNNISPSLTSTIDTPSPLTCEGTRTYLYAYTDCAGNSSNWSFVYTIDISTNPIVPADGGATVDCVSEAIAPTTPVVADACGNNIIPVLVSTIDNPNPLVCGGSRTYNYSYTDCSGSSSSWSYIYSINAPVISVVCPMDQSFDASSSNNYTIPELIALDNCSGGFNVTYSITGVTVRNGVGTDASGLFNVGISDIAWTVTDQCGTVHTCNTEVEIIFPTIVCPLAFDICVNNSVQQLNGTGENPSGGVFSGFGVNNNAGNYFFNPTIGVGTHTITYTWTNSSGYSGICTFDITVNPLPDFNASVTSLPSCNGDDDAEISIAITQGTAMFDIDWETGNSSTGLMNYTINNLSAGDYDISIIDANSCVATGFITIDQTPILQVTLNQTAAQCGSVGGDVTTLVSGGTGTYDYAWSNTTSADNLSNVAPGNYSVDVTDENDCVATQDIDVGITGAISANITVNQFISCSGSCDGVLQAESNNGVSPLYFSWSTESALSTISNLCADSYVVTITDSWGCIGSENQSLIDPASIAITSTINHVSCYGNSDGSIVLNVGGGTSPYVYDWDGMSSDYRIDSLSAGSYIVTITDLANCSISASYDVTQPDELFLTYLLNDVTCFGYNDGGVLMNASGGSGPYNFQVSNGVTFGEGASQLNLPFGSYTLIVHDNNSCSKMTNVIIQEPSEIIATYITNDPSCAGNNDGFIEIAVIGGTSPYLFGWDENYIDFPLITGLLDGNYDVSVMDANNCEIYLGEVVLTENPDDCIKIPNAFTPNSDAINDTWIIENLDLFPGAHAYVYNRWGQEIFNGTPDEDPWDGRFNNKYVPTGSYLYIINLYNGSITYTGTVTVIY